METREAKQDGAGEFLAATSRADITPPAGIAHGNWGAAVHERAEGIDMPLFVTVLAVRGAGDPVLILDFDLLHLSNELSSRLRTRIAGVTGVPASNIRVSASHTHSGPTLSTGTWLREGVDFVESYIDSLIDKAAGSCWEALRSLEPAAIGAARGECCVNVNRRQTLEDGRVVVGQNPDGFVDPELLVIRIDDSAGKPIANVVNYACHPTIMSYANRLITPDYPGPLRRTVEDAVGGRCLFLQGCAGNLASVEDLSNDAASYVRIGRRIGLRAAELALSIETDRIETEFRHVLHSGADLAIFARRKSASPIPPVRVFERAVTLPAVALPDVVTIESELGALKEEVERLRSGAKPGEEGGALRDALYRARRAYIQLNRAKATGGRSEIDLPLQLITMGDIALLSAPVELFAEIGAQVKERSPFPVTCVSGYSNGVYAYLPTSAAYSEGGYEIDVSPFARGAEEVFVEGALSLLREAWGAGDTGRAAAQ